MAVGSDTGTGQVGLTEEQKQILARARKPVNIANKFRVAFLFIGVITFFFIFLGDKVWEDAVQYGNIVRCLYQFLVGDILLMLFSTLIKFGFVVRYNGIVRKISL